MLSASDNETLTRVGPGTLMGDLFRQYWLPALSSSELAYADGPPVRVRLLGENLVAFRNTHGEVGLLGEQCPHRGVSLYYGRNEQDGLRCVYHGWKYDVTGQCVDMPSEPSASNFRDKVRQTAYPCVERNGLLWTYMGPSAEAPAPPEYEFAVVPEAHNVSAPITLACNWLQILEGDLDSVHSDFLHSALTDAEIAGGRSPVDPEGYVPPSVEVAQADYGLAKGARRDHGDDEYYWRIYQYMLPAVVLLPANQDSIMYRMTIPIDDDHTTFWNGQYCPSRPLSDEERQRHLASRAPGGYQAPTADPRSRWRPVANRDNDYLLDREAQVTKRYSGIPPIKLQDVAMTESMGPVMNRTREHLGTTDSAIIQMRRVMLCAANALREFGTVPAGVDDPSVFRVRSATAILPRDVSWLAETQRALQAIPDEPVLSAPRPSVR